MRRLGAGFRLLALACAVESLNACSAADPRSGAGLPRSAASTAQVAPAPTPQPATPGADLARERALVDATSAALEAADYTTAHAQAAAAVTALLARPESEQDSAWLHVLGSAGDAAWNAQDAEGARKAWQRVHEIRSRTLPDDHPDLQAARLKLAASIKVLGDLAGARALEEQALEVFSRILPEDHPDLQTARNNLATTIGSLGDLAGARALFEQVLEVRSRILPSDDRDLQAARLNLALTIKTLGDLAGAGELEKQVLEAFSRTLPADHADLQAARLNLAGTMKALGDLAGARRLEEQLLEVRARTLPDEHPDLQRVRNNLADTKYQLGDLAGARALQEQVLEIRSRTLPEDHPDIQKARSNLGNTLHSLGDLSRARALHEKAHAFFSRTFPDDHPFLQLSRQNLAATLMEQGDLAAARGLVEQVLEVRARELPDDHPDLQDAQLSLAQTMSSLGDLSAARALEERVLEVRSRTLPSDHPDLQAVRSNLAATLYMLGDPAGSRALQEQVLEARSRTLPVDHPGIQAARKNLALTLKALGDVAGARVLEEQALEALSRTLPDEHPDVRCARHNLADTLAILENDVALRAQVLAYDRGLQRLIEEAILTSGSREAEERMAREAHHLSLALSFANGSTMLGSDPVLEREAFVLIETARDAAGATAALRNLVRADAEAGVLFDRARAASAELTRLGQAAGSRDEFLRSARQRDEAQRELLGLVQARGGGAGLLEAPEPAALARRLRPGEALVGYWRYSRWTWERTESAILVTHGIESLLAHVVRPDGTLLRIELGPLAAIEQAALRWRDALLAPVERGLAPAPRPDRERAAGEELRRLVLDPLRAAIGDSSTLIVALDDVLHAVPLDALPAGDADEDGARVGERLRVLLRPSLRDILQDERPPMSGGSLIALGDASFNSPPASAAEAGAQPSGSSGASASAWQRQFEPLLETGTEARAVLGIYQEVFGEHAPATLLQKRAASRASIEALAPGARFLHVATHGWFAPDSVRSLADPQPGRGAAVVSAASHEERVRGLAPLLLCGLALTGANLPPDALGRIPGVLTAEELSGWDLSACELAVTSACDTNVGLRRAGQGVASLQRALHIAGARSAITSLWKVPDEATKELMVDFYRRLWVEEKPAAQALWEAKLALRDAVDDTGDARYTTRDWAAWVLTGDPR